MARNSATESVEMPFDIEDRNASTVPMAGAWELGAEVVGAEANGAAANGAAATGLGAADFSEVEAEAAVEDGAADVVGTILLIVSIPESPTHNFCSETVRPGYGAWMTVSFPA
ncbi:MAG: hypothetical protein QOI14_515 [Actinomycetota bacterium]|nr:hypothetical protein [Actinomycetota bacterium]